MDRIDAMSTLIAVVEQGSLSAGRPRARSARDHRQPSLSDLEASLRTRLLIRTTRKLTVTDAGAAFISAARRIRGAGGRGGA